MLSSKHIKVQLGPPVRNVKLLADRAALDLLTGQDIMVALDILVVFNYDELGGRQGGVRGRGGHHELLIYCSR